MLGLLLLIGGAHAASLDLLEVGGAWGTPGATNPTAVWWNPAGLAAGSGTQFLVEGAPTLANLNFDRTSPTYDAKIGGPPAEFDYGGSERIRFAGVVPFLGVSSDFGVEDLGVGLSLSVPFARGGTQDPDGGPGQFHLEEGNIQAIFLSAGAGWTFFDKVSVGVSGAYVHSTWDARTQVETLKSLRDGITETGLGDPYCDGSNCDDYLFEDPNYTTELDFAPLRDTAFTFGAGIYVQPVDQVGISLGYNHGLKLVHQGDLSFQFGCPTDPLGSFAADLSGLCNADADGAGTIGYTLPSRLNVGVVLKPVDTTRIEVMGGWVGWSAFTDYDIGIDVGAEEFQDEVCADADGNALECTEIQTNTIAETADLVTQDRQWARDNRDTFWLGADAKVRVHRFVTLGARAIYDRSAIPSSALSTNNFDANTLNLGALVVVSPLDTLDIGLSYGRQILATRTVTDSAFDVTLGDDAKPDRYFYPSANGTYAAGINRFGISVQGRFLSKKTM